MYKNLIIYDFETIDMWILVDEACHFTDCSNITSLRRHNGIILKI